MATKNKTVTMYDFHEMQRLRHLINSTKLENLKFFDGDKRMKITSKMIYDWKFTGMNNCDFVEMVLLGSGWKKPR